MSIFSRGARPNYVRHKSTIIFPDQETNPFNIEAYGRFIAQVVVPGVGTCTRMLISFPTVYMNYIHPADANQSTALYGSVAKSLYNEYADKYRYWRISGLKIKFYPKYNVVATTMYPRYQTSISIPGTSTGVTTSIPVGGQYGFTGAYDPPLEAAGIRTEYDPVARKSIGFASPFLTLSSQPFINTTNNDLMKYMNSNFKKLIFKGGYQSIYYKFYRNTGDSVVGAKQGDSQSQQILVGWRPTGYSTPTGFAVYDEQGLALLLPFSYRDLNTRYSISITFYFKFLYEKGPRVSTVDEPGS